MAKPRPVTRDILRKISEDHRWIRMMEQLLDLIPADTIALQEIIEEVEFEAGLALVRAQQAIDSLPIKKAYGAFYDTTDQAAGSPNTPTAATFNVTQETDGMSLSGSQFTVVKSGLYKIELRVQL